MADTRKEPLRPVFFRRGETPASIIAQEWRKQLEGPLALATRWKEKLENLLLMR